MTVNFCNIYPTSYLEMCKDQHVHLCLAHLVESDEKYREFYNNLDKTDHKIILDNSAFEMFKQHKPMFESSKLIDIGHSIGADIIVLSDYPGVHSKKTMDAADKLIPEFCDNGFGTFFVPQSEFGDLDQYVDCVKYGLQHEKIDLIGLSILGCPRALGIIDDNRLQRYLSRYHMLNILEQRGLLEDVTNKFHCLGLLDGPNEIELLKSFHNYIYSWDSSSAIWAGINKVKYDHTPTGLVNGKIESEVMFNIDYDDSCKEYIEYNKERIRTLCS